MNWEIDLKVYDDRTGCAVPGPTFDTDTAADIHRLGLIVSGQADIPGLAPDTRHWFIHENHLAGFVECAAKENLYISVRESGRNTLAQLPKHYACKPHEILDKTLKPESHAGTESSQN